MPKLSSRPIDEHAEVPLADDGRWEAVLERWTRAPTATTERASFVVSINQDRDPAVRASALAEIVALTQHQGDLIVGSEVVHLATPNARTLLGAGRARELAERARDAGATLLVVDAELSPSQTRNLEDVAGMPVSDREAVILNVFSRHAQSRRARNQVEIARLEYLRPRIRGVGLDMDQQAGGAALARGPGETESELLARKIDSRIAHLKRGLRKLQISSMTQRRGRAGQRRVALVGYTNAGKTSLMNALTGADLSARDMPFETLDTTSRCLTRHGGDVILSDTVGFIRRLPERLIASFESTLAEIAEADLLVVVVDAGDYERHAHVQTTLDVLSRIGADRVPRLWVYSKVDRLSDVEIRSLKAPATGEPFLALSARAGLGVGELASSIVSAARTDDVELTALFPYDAREALALAYGRCRVERSTATEEGLVLELTGRPDVIAILRRKCQ